jgi:hypothetical protein
VGAVRIEVLSAAGTHAGGCAGTQCSLSPLLIAGARPFLRLPNLEANGDFTKAEVTAIWNYQLRSGARSLKFGTWCGGGAEKQREGDGGSRRTTAAAAAAGRGWVSRCAWRSLTARSGATPWVRVSWVTRLRLTARAPPYRAPSPLPRPPTVGYEASSACGAEAVPMAFTPDAPIGASGVDAAAVLSSEGLWRCAAGAPVGSESGGQQEE